MADPFIGEIKLVSFPFAPQGYAFCQGQSLSVAQNQALFALIQYTYGGSGQSFNLPNLQSRVAIGTGQGAGLSPYSLGQTGGAENVNLNLNQIPNHNHMLMASDQPANQPVATNNYLPSNSARSTALLYANTVSNAQAMNPNSISAVGGSQPHANIQPYLSLNYIIALVGIFPTRS